MDTEQESMRPREIWNPDGGSYYQDAHSFQDAFELDPKTLRTLYMKSKPIAHLLRYTEVIWTQSSFFLITVEELCVFCGYQQLRWWKDITFLWSYFQSLSTWIPTLQNWCVTLIMKSQCGEFSSEAKCLYRLNAVKLHLFNQKEKVFHFHSKYHPAKGEQVAWTSVSTWTMRGERN